MQYMSNVIKRYVSLGYSFHSRELLSNEEPFVNNENNENVNSLNRLEPSHIPNCTSSQSIQVDRLGTMDAENEEKMNLMQEVSRLKLEMNQLKQENTTLMLEIQKKEEVNLKAEAEAHQKEAQLRIEIKQLTEKLDSKKPDNNTNDELQLVQSEYKECLGKMKKLSEEHMHYKKIMNEYESNLSGKTCDLERMKMENATLKKHLAALESAFSDQNQKYERCKEIIAGYGRNEETLKSTLEKTRQIAIKYEERYETLKTHANSQLDKAHKDVLALKDTHKSEMTKLSTLIKRLEIKNDSLQQTLEQKTSECTALASLCDEMTSGINPG